MKNKFSMPLIAVGLTNLILFMIKLYIGIRTNSLCVYTDSINNLLDTVSAILAFSTTIFITKKATKNHPFGFGRLEYILEFLMSLIITITGLYFAYSSIVRLSMPTPVWFYIKFAYILGATCLVKLLLALIFHKLYKKTNSVIFKTIMLDSILDCSVTVVALISFTLSNSTGIVIDGFLGLLISIIITTSGIKLVASSVSTLLGKTDNNLEEKIKVQVESIDKDIKINSIIINDYGIDNKYVSIMLGGLSLDHQSEYKKQIKEKLKALGINNVIIELGE